jgi:hypothetical protein
MKRFPIPILLVLLASVCLVVIACGTSSTGTSTGGTHSSTTASPSATATATAVTSHPASVPVASVAECGKLLSLSEANQYTNPPSPATAIYAYAGTGTNIGGTLCYYEDATRQATVLIIFNPYSGGNLSTNVQKEASGSLSQVTITSTQPVSGIGDQALFVTASGTASANGVSYTVKENALFVVVGAVLLDILNGIYGGLDPLGSASPATVLSDFEQIARVVISRL